MATKILPWTFVTIAILIAIIAILASRKPPEIIHTETVIDTLVVTNTVHTQTNRDKVITKYDTLYVDNHQYTVAEYQETIDTTNVKVELNVKYWEQLRKFDVQTDITAEIPTVYITKTITNTVEKPYPTFAMTAGLSPMFMKKEGDIALQNIGLAAGVRIKGKYDIELAGTTDETFGLGFRVRF